MDLGYIEYRFVIFYFYNILFYFYIHKLMYYILAYIDYKRYMKAFNEINLRKHEISFQNILSAKYLTFNISSLSITFFYSKIKLIKYFFAYLRNICILIIIVNVYIHLFHAKIN